jgi:hypothetical protein
MTTIEARQFTISTRTLAAVVAAVLIALVLAIVLPLSLRTTHTASVDKVVYNPPAITLTPLEIR